MDLKIVETTNSLDKDNRQNYQIYLTFDPSGLEAHDNFVIFGNLTFEGYEVSSTRHEPLSVIMDTNARVKLQYRLKDANELPEGARLDTRFRRRRGQVTLAENSFVWQGGQWVAVAADAE